jgi:PhzF family phenazine biosynthesis protein
MQTCKVVDVFMDQPLLGNPVAEVLDSDGLDGDAMQAIARWTNLAETTFLMPPSTTEADDRLRIFPPRSELPFAGHPTVGGAHAAAASWSGTTARRQAGAGMRGGRRPRLSQRQWKHGGVPA